VAGNIVTAWVLTLPAAAVVGGVTYALVALLGTEGLGPLAVSAALLAALAVALGRRLVAGRTLTAEG
jgi:PiT family inorganic phosphate transporter